MSPIIKECTKRNLDFFIIHTNQHYSHYMDKLFFEELELPQARYNLNAGSSTFRQQVGIMLKGIKQILIKENPTNVFVLGDTNSVLAGALAANQLHIKLGHIEAGLRSHDISMLEETTRIITDHISDHLFAPTQISESYLLEEGINENKIFVTGNVIVDAVLKYNEFANQKSDILEKLNLEKQNYMLVTIHRAENVDYRERLSKILEGLRLIGEKYKTTLVFPIHPRTEKMIKHFNLKIPDNMNLIQPTGFLDLLKLQNNAKLILTDSGGLQEESCILKTPCVTLRDNTERSETVEVGSNLIAGIESESILNCAEKIINKDRNWVNPFGDGKSAKRIIEAIIN